MTVSQSEGGFDCTLTTQVGAAPPEHPQTRVMLTARHASSSLGPAIDMGHGRRGAPEMAWLLTRGRMLMGVGGLRVC